MNIKKFFTNYKMTVSHCPRIIVVLLFATSPIFTKTAVANTIGYNLAMTTYRQNPWFIVQNYPTEEAFEKAARAFHIDETSKVDPGKYTKKQSDEWCKKTCKQEQCTIESTRNNGGIVNTSCATSGTKWLINKDGSVKQLEQKPKLAANEYSTIIDCTKNCTAANKGCYKKSSSEEIYVCRDNPAVTPEPKDEIKEEDLTGAVASSPVASTYSPDNFEECQTGLLADVKAIAKGNTYARVILRDTDDDPSIKRKYKLFKNAELNAKTDQNNIDDFTKKELVPTYCGHLKPKPRIDTTVPQINANSVGVTYDECEQGVKDDYENIYQNNNNAQRFVIPASEDNNISQLMVHKNKQEIITELLETYCDKYKKTEPEATQPVPDDVYNLEADATYTEIVAEYRNKVKPLLTAKCKTLNINSINDGFKKQVEEYAKTKKNDNAKNLLMATAQKEMDANYQRCDKLPFFDDKVQKIKNTYSEKSKSFAQKAK